MIPHTILLMVKTRIKKKLLVKKFLARIVHQKEHKMIKKIDPNQHVIYTSIEQDNLIVITLLM